MEPKFQSSFIPKGPIATSGTVTSRATSSKSRGLFVFLSLIIFTLSVFVSIGIFAYHKYLESNISKMSTDLEEAKRSLEPETIEMVTKLDSRIVATKELLKNHQILSPFFEFLEASTLRAVRFSNFQYSTSDKGIEVRLNGQAKGYAAVAKQSEIFSSSEYIQNPVFGDLKLDDKGNVIFSFKANLNPDLVSYRRKIQAGKLSPGQKSGFTATTTQTVNVGTTTSTSSPKR